MDLYKWATKLTPAVSSELVMNCFDLARDLRRLDMRASPYDVTVLGDEPILIETPVGKADYLATLHPLMTRAAACGAGCSWSATPCCRSTPASRPFGVDKSSVPWFIGRVMNQEEEPTRDGFRRGATDLPRPGGPDGRRHPRGHLPEETQVPSTNELARTTGSTRPPPARRSTASSTRTSSTKKRGLGMFVATGAPRRSGPRGGPPSPPSSSSPLLDEAARVGLTTDEIVTMIKDQS